MTGVTLQTGTVSAVDADGVKARVRLPECDNMRTNWLDVLQRNTQNNKDYWLPDVGEQVKVLLDENGEDGVILGAVYSDVDKPPFGNKDVRGTTFSDGAEFSYNRASHTLTRTFSTLAHSSWQATFMTFSSDGCVACAVLCEGVNRLLAYGADGFDRIQCAIVDGRQRVTLGDR